MRAFLLLSILISACNPAQQTSAPSATTALLPTPSQGSAVPLPSTGGPPPALADVRWHRSSLEVGPTEAVLDVAATSFGWVAGGSQLNIPEPDATIAPGDNPLAHLNSAAIWTSQDGLNWVRAPDGPEFDGSRIHTITAHGTGALAFGVGGFCLPDACGGLPPNGGTIVWSSSDGSHWERLAHTGLEDGAVTAVVETRTGWIAVGYVADRQNKPDTDSFSDPTDATVWRSVDGETWTEVQALPVAGRMQFVAADGDLLVAMGSEGLESDVWTSADGGGSWSSAAGFVGPCCETVSAIGPQVIVASHQESDRAKGVDGIVMTADMSDATFSTLTPKVMRSYRPVSASAIGGSLVVFGFKNHLDTDSMIVDDAPAAWSTRDGAAWVDPALPAEWGAQAPIAVGQDARGIVVVLRPMDTLNGPGDLRQSIWFAR